MTKKIVAFCGIGSQVQLSEELHSTKERQKQEAVHEDVVAA